MQLQLLVGICIHLCICGQLLAVLAARPAEIQLNSQFLYLNYRCTVYIRDVAYILQTHFVYLICMTPSSVRYYWVVTAVKIYKIIQLFGDSAVSHRDLSNYVG